MIAAGGAMTDRPVRDAAYWDERYRSAPALWSGEPNPQLLTEAADLQPGQALEVGCGEGADAIWLAQRGWDVTAADISAVALERAAANVAALERADLAARITWQQADLTAWAPEVARYDLAAMLFVHLRPEQRDGAFARLAAAVAPGGTLLVVAHHPLDLQLEGMGPPEPELFFTADDAAAVLGPDWRIVVSAARPREATDPDGKPVTIHVTILRAERAHIPPG
jgi:SAM-dependent methyltransferase